MEHSKQGETKVTLFSFFLAGTSLWLSYPLIMTATEDILSGLALPSSVVLISISIPGVLVAMTSPIFFDRIGNSTKIIAATLFIIIGLLIVSLSQREWKLAGVALISASTSIGEMSFLSFTIFYEASALDAYCTGAGLGILLANFYYVGMTVILHVSPRAIMLAMSWVPLLLAVSYLILKKQDTGRLEVPKSSYGDYKPLALKEQQNRFLPNTTLSGKEKLLAIWDTLHHIIALVIVTFCAFVSLQGIATTLVYKPSSLSPREVYVIYSICVTCSSSLTRSYGFVITAVNPSFNPYTKHTWAIAAAEVPLMLFLLVDSWYRFLNSTLLVCLLLISIGLVFGFQCVNVFAMVGVSEDKRKSAVTRAFSRVAWDTGVLMAGMMALYVEPIIYEHCLYVTNGKVELCLARSTTSVL